MNLLLPPHIRVVPDADAQHLHLDGPVGVLDADALHAAACALADGGADVVVHGEAVDHLDCAALQILLALRAELARTGRRLELRAVPPLVHRYLCLAGVDRALAPVAGDTGAAHPPPAPPPPS